MNAPAPIMSSVPDATLAWLTAEENPAVAVLTRRTLMGEPDSPELDALWARRNEYPPVAEILARVQGDGTWMKPSQDYKKYQGNLWQVHLLGEMHADGSDPRIQAAADYAFSRQLADGSWSCNGKSSASIPCLTANVGRALARMGWARDERVVAALKHTGDLYRELGIVDCRFALEFQLNGYCHMLTPKELLFMAEVPRELWPEGTTDLRDACVSALRDKQVYRSLPEESREFNDIVWSAKASERDGLREQFLAKHPTLHYKEKPGWLRFGYPLSYNSDALEALVALMRVGEPPRAEYEDAIQLLRASAAKDMRWTLKNTFNGKMYADIEAKGEPSRWLTLRALQVLAWAEA